MPTPQARFAAVLPLVATLALATPPSAVGQSMYLAAGVGPTPVLEGSSANRNWFGMVGYSGPRGLGVRLSGAETASRLWLSADLTLQLRTGHRVSPYAFLGGGGVADLGESDPLLTLGGGTRARLGRLIFIFAELRLQTIPGSPLANPGTILPLTLGIGVGN